AEEHRLNRRKLSADSSSSLGCRNWCDVTSGTKTRTFFAHWCIRNAASQLFRLPDLPPKLIAPGANSLTRLSKDGDAPTVMAFAECLQISRSDQELPTYSNSPD